MSVPRTLIHGFALLLTSALMVSGAVFAPAAYASEPAPPTTETASEEDQQPAPENQADAQQDPQHGDQPEQLEPPILEAPEIAENSAAVEDVETHAPAQAQTPTQAQAPAQTQGAVTATVSQVTSESSIEVRVEAHGLPSGVTAVYAALIEHGTEAALADASSADYTAFALPFPAVTNGSSTFTLTAPKAKLDRAKAYEVLVWRQHAKPNSDTIYGRDDVEITPGDWDRLFPAPTETPQAGNLVWGFTSGWNFYVKNIAAGSITASQGATQNAHGSIGYQQVSGGNYDPKTGYGTIKYQGMVRYVSKLHGFDIALKNPWVQFNKKDTTISAEVSRSDTPEADDLTRIVVATIGAGKPTAGENGTLDWAQVEGTFAENIQPAGWQRYANTSIDPVSFSYGAEAGATPNEPTGQVAAQPQPKPIIQPKPAQPKPVAQSGQSAGSLVWGVSTAFTNYVTGSIAKGNITTQGVGGGRGAYVFPQAGGAHWNEATHTGSVPFSGVVTFSGHHGQMNETVSNPVITIRNASSGTITANGRVFSLNLAAGNKRVAPNGEVTWSGVPVAGGFSFGSHSLAADAVTFTVGATSAASYGSFSDGGSAMQRAAASETPEVGGLTVKTQPEKIRAGSTIELLASGFQPNEYGIMVVLYPGAVVMDENATANSDGTVRWAGKLPTDLAAGRYTISLQGSTTVASVIQVNTADAKQTLTLEVDKETVNEAGLAGVAHAVTSESQSPSHTGLWLGAVTLLLLAGATSALAVTQRRRMNSTTGTRPDSHVKL